MKKLIVGLCLLSLASFAENFIDSVPSGRYVGTGNWSDNQGNKGDYTTTLEIDDNAVSVHYSWDGGELALNWYFSFYEEGQFEVLHNDNKVGEGECDPDYCVYTYDINGVSGQDTLQFNYGGVAGNLYKSGYEVLSEDRIITWEESLTDAALTSPPADDTQSPIQAPTDQAPIEQAPTDQIPVR